MTASLKWTWYLTGSQCNLAGIGVMCSWWVFMARTDPIPLYSSFQLKSSQAVSSQQSVFAGFDSKVLRGEESSYSRQMHLIPRQMVQMEVNEHVRHSIWSINCHSSLKCLLVLVTTGLSFSFFRLSFHPTLSPHLPVSATVLCTHHAHHICRLSA